MATNLDSPEYYRFTCFLFSVPQYISYARKYVHPKLSSEAADVLQVRKMLSGFRVLSDIEFISESQLSL